METRKTFKALSIKETLELLDQYKDKAKMIAGGTDIVIELRNKEINPEVLIDISSIKEMRYIKEDGDYIALGAATTFTDVVESPLFDGPLNGFKESSRLVGSPLIRGRGTVGGNICNGSPAADTVPPLLALDAVVTIKSLTNTREVRLEDLFLDKGSVDLKADELLTDIKFKKPEDNEKLGFSKLGLRNALAISRICISALVGLDESDIIENIKIASGSLGKHGLREKTVEEFMKGKTLNQDTIDQATEKMAQLVKTRLEGRSSLEYKGKAVEGIFRRAIEDAIIDKRGEVYEKN